MRVHNQVSCYLHLTGHTSGQVQSLTKHETCFETKRKKTEKAEKEKTEKAEKRKKKKKKKIEEKIQVGVDGNGEKI